MAMGPVTGAHGTVRWWMRSSAQARPGRSRRVKRAGGSELEPADRRWSGARGCSAGIAAAWIGQVRSWPDRRRLGGSSWPRPKGLGIGGAIEVVDLVVLEPDRQPRVTVALLLPRFFSS